MAAKETWENLSNQAGVIPSISARGEVGQKIVPPRRTFQISEEERRAYHDRAVDEKQDKFMNGTYQPVKVLEDSADYAELAAAPGRFSDDDLKAMLKGQAASVAKKVAEIDNPVTVRRLVELAVEEDLSRSKLTVLEDRLSELTEIPNDPLEEDPDSL